MPERRCAEILLVEDSPDDVELTLHALTKARVANKVTVARDGAEALDYLFGTGALPGRCCLETPLVVLLDLKLPKVSGIEVLRRIRSDPRTHAVPVIALTSSREDRDIAETYELGVNSYIRSASMAPGAGPIRRLARSSRCRGSIGIARSPQPRFVLKGGFHPDVGPPINSRSTKGLADLGGQL